MFEQFAYNFDSWCQVMPELRLSHVCGQLNECMIAVVWLADDVVLCGVFDTVIEKYSAPYELGRVINEVSCLSLFSLKMSASSLVCLLA